MNIPKLTLPRWPRAERAREPAGAIPLSLVRSAKAASWIAYFCLVYFLWLYTLDIARDRAEPLHVTHMGTWVGEVRIWFPVIVGFAVIAIGIPYVAKIAIPTFMSLNWRENAWPKGWALFIAVSVSVVVFAGTFTVQGDAILEKGRESAVAVEKVEMNRAMIDGQIAAKEAELKSMMENRNAYLAQAASVGAAEWERSYIAKTPASDPQRDRIVRALGAARAADSVRADLVTLRTQKAASGAVAAVSERIEQKSSANNWIAATIDWIQGARAILLSFVMDIVALLMPWIALRLEQARARQMADAPAEPDVFMIEDHSAEAVPEAQPYTQAAEKREQYFDEDGNKIVRRKATWAKVPTKKSGRKEVDPKTGKKVEDSTEYELPARESRLNEVYDGAEVSEVSVGASEAISDGEAHALVAGRDHDDPAAGDALSSEETLTPEPEEKADDLLAAEQVAPPENADDIPLDPPADAQDPAPLILADEEVDRLIDKGVLVEDDDGVITAVSQEDQPIIEQPADPVAEAYAKFAANRGLPAPKRETEEAA